MTQKKESIIDSEDKIVNVFEVFPERRHTEFYVPQASLFHKISEKECFFRNNNDVFHIINGFNQRIIIFWQNKSIVSNMLLNGG